MKSGKFISQQTFDIEDFHLVQRFDDCRFVKWFAQKYGLRTQVIPKYVFKIVSDWIHPNYEVYMFTDTSNHVPGRYYAVQLHRREKESLYKEYLEV